MKRNKTGLAIFVTALLLLCSNESLAAAQRAVYGFWKSFLPAMLPFFLLTPYLTGPDAQRAFSRAFGRAFEKLFRVPGSTAGAVLSGFAAGSPAGSIACAMASRGMSTGEYARACFLASGLSPAFLITAVGSGYLGDQQAGLILYISHVGALLLGGVLLRRTEPEWHREEGMAAKAASDDIFLNALANLGKVLCWMVVFGVFSAIICQWIGGIVPGWLLSGLCEISGGAEELAGAPMSHEARMLLLSACTGFGGFCVLMQCVSATGVPMRIMLGAKALHAILSTGITYLLLHADALPDISWPEDIFGASVLLALALVLLAVMLILAGRKNRVDAGLSGLYTNTNGNDS